MTPERVSVGIVMPLGSQQGGAEALFQHLLRHGSQQFRYVCAFLQDGPVVEEARALGYDTSMFPTTHLRNTGNYLQTVSALRSWMKQKKLGVVFSWMLKAHLYVAPAAVGTRVKTLWFQHGISTKGPMDRVATLLPTQAILCCSEHAKRAQDELFPGRQSHVCYPGVSFPAGDPISQEEARARLGLSQTNKVVGMVARWERWKGSHVFIEAAKAVIAVAPDTTCFLVGGAHPLDLAYAEELKTLATEAGLRNQFILAGQRPASEVPLWHASADLIVHPVTVAEPFGMAVAEAMGMGKVVIASALGGPAESIQDGVNGVLIPPADPGALASAILKLLGDRDRRQRMAVEAYRRGRSFSIDAFAARFDHLLSGVSMTPTNSIDTRAPLGLEQ